MDFSDFKDNPNGLVGKYVLYENGYIYSERLERRIARISSVTKTGFKVLINDQSLLFNLIDGDQKGRSGSCFVSRCKLLTEQEAKELYEEWERDKSTRRAKKELSAYIESMTLAQAQLMNFVYHTSLWMSEDELAELLKPKDAMENLLAFWRSQIKS